MSTVQFWMLLGCTLVGGPLIYWALSSRNARDRWSGLLSLTLADETFVHVKNHGSVKMPQPDSVITGFILHGVPVGMVPFIYLSSPDRMGTEIILCYGDLYRDVIERGDVLFRFTKHIPPQWEFEIRFVTCHKLRNTLGFLKERREFGGETYYESFVVIKWPEANVIAVSASA